MSRRKLCRARAFAVFAVVVVLGLFGTAAVAGAAAPEYRGVQLHSLWSDSSQADMDRELDLARGANANVVRVDVVWGSLERGGKGEYSSWYVSKLDRFVEGASARGMKVIATLWSSPCWASSAPESVKQGCEGAWWDRGVGAYPPSDPADYGDAAKFVTERYGTKLAALEVWNEPNLEDSDRFWKTSNKAGDYAKLVKAAYPRAKAGNAGVPVLAGALAFADRPFLDALYANGIKGYHDGISIHPYNEARDPADRWKAEWKKYTLLPGIEWIRQGQVAAGEPKPIWVTEFGWTTGTASGWQVSEQKQADYVRKSLPLLGAYSYLKSAVLYNLRDKGTNPTSHEENFGLLNHNFTPKPAYAALRQGIDDATSGPPVPPLPPAPPLPPVPPAPVPQPPQAPPVEPSGGPASTPASPAAGSPPRAAPVEAGTPLPTRGRRARVTVEVERRRGAARAVGTGPRGGRLRLRISGCPRTSIAARVLEVRVSARGRFSRRLGSARHIAGCRVTVRVPGGPVAAIASQA